MSVISTTEYNVFLDKVHKYLSGDPSLADELETYPGHFHGYLMQHVSVALTTHDATFVLDKFIGMILESDRYINECLDTINEAIGRCISAGATFNYECLFTPKFTGNDNIEDEAQNHRIRGHLIDKYSHLITFPSEWTEIPPIYWEYFDKNRGTSELPDFHYPNPDQFKHYMYASLKQASRRL